MLKPYWKRYILLPFFILSFGIQGCTKAPLISSSTTLTPTSSLSVTTTMLLTTPTVAIPLTTTPTSSPPPSPTPSPTLSPTPLPTAAPQEAADYINRLLDPAVCALPCIFGVTVGRSSVNEAKHTWGMLGTFLRFQGETTAEEELKRKLPTSNGEIYLYLNYSYSLHPDIVQRVAFGLSTKPEAVKIWRHWQMFSITGIGKYWGIPDQVYFSLDFAWRGALIALAYNGDINRMVLYGGDVEQVSQKDVQICTDAAQFSIDAWPSSEESLTASQYLEKEWADPVLTKTSEEAINMSPREFIDYVWRHQDAHGRVCFTTPIDIWPPPHRPEP